MEMTALCSISEVIRFADGSVKLSYGGKDFVIPHLSNNNGFFFFPSVDSAVRRQEGIPIMEDMNTVWDYQKLGKLIRHPIHIGTIPVQEHPAFYRFSPSKGIRILDMPIKFPGSMEYRIPKELHDFITTIRLIADYEFSINGDMDADLYCYLTIDQEELQHGQVHRNKGCHVDGFQGARISPKVKLDHSFITSNTLPTIFYLQQFDVQNLDPLHDNYFLHFQKQVKEEFKWRPKPFEIVLFDAYTVRNGFTHLCCQMYWIDGVNPIHFAAQMSKSEYFVHKYKVHEGDQWMGESPVQRTVLRMSYTVRVFDRLGNTHNPLFDYQWDMVARDFQGQIK